MNDGQGCEVVGTNAVRRLQRIAWHIPPRLVEEMLFTPVGASVEVLLDDGTIVRTTTRSRPWNFGGDSASALIALDGFTGGYSLTRVRPPGFAWSRS